MSSRKSILIGLAGLLLASCGDGGSELMQIPSQPNRDALPGGLFHDFYDEEKFDAAGHPHAAQVFDGRDRCAPTTGDVGVPGIVAEADRDRPGVLCGGATKPLGEGTFTLNARALVDSVDHVAPDETLLEIVIFDDDGEIESRSITAADFGEERVEHDLAVTFRHRSDTPVKFDVHWTGAASARLAYVEVFRSTPRLVVSPASQPLDFDEGPTFQIEMQDPPRDVSFEVECDGTDVTDVLTELLESGQAKWQDTEFRTIVSAPADRLLARCETPSRVKVRAVARGFTRETSRVTYHAEPIPCAFSSDDPDLPRVLLTGFEPFPADSDRDNSSKEAVDAYVADAPDDVAVMRAILPVEYDTAPAMMKDLVGRCEPDVIIGFGQGRTTVDVEQIAYNRKDTAAIFGGVPDNRGVIYGGAPITEGGPAEQTTELPVEAILAGLDALGIEGLPSTDPGRYVCNNLFYIIMDIVGAHAERTGGFVHLPRIPNVEETERETLRRTVATVVTATLERHLAAR